MLMFLFGLMLVISGGLIMRFVYNLGEYYERFIFERKNEYGVVIVNSYEEKKMLERWDYKNYLIGKPLIFISLAMLLVGWLVMGIPVVQLLRS